MRTFGIQTVAIALFASLAPGQTPTPVLDRVFSFTNAATVQDIEQIRMMFRSLASVREEIYTGPGPSSLTLRGTPEQIALAEWLFRELDKVPAPGQAAPAQEYRVPGGDDVVRIFRLANAPAPRDIQEVAVSVRTMAAATRLFFLTATPTIILRGTASQVSFVEWLVNALDKPANGVTALSDQNSATQEYRLTIQADDIARVYYLSNAITPPMLREIAVFIRTTAKLQRLFIYDSLRAVGMRGTAAQMAVADGLIKERDR